MNMPWVLWSDPCGQEILWHKIVWLVLIVAPLAIGAGAALWIAVMLRVLHQPAAGQEGAGEGGP